jgi:prephenate dehydrogenase
MTTKGARIIGAGLIGTSIALRLKEIGWDVSVSDRDKSAEGLAKDLLSSHELDFTPNLVVVATPPSEVLPTLLTEERNHPKATFIDVSSIKTKTQLEVQAFPALSERYIGTHPIAGREQSGPQSARSDLFFGRAWILTASPTNSSERVKEVESFIRELGATPYRMDPNEHDRLFARISHIPQILSTSLARLVESSGEGIELSGQGLRDMLRLAGSNGNLWSEILLTNSNEVLNGIRDFSKLLEEIELAIESKDKAKLLEIFKAGNLVQGKLSGKHGGMPREYSHLSVVIEDRPGQLGALFNECAEVAANVEDLSLEHSPKQETGLIKLSLSKSDSAKLYKHLLEKGWRVHQQ